MQSIAYKQATEQDIDMLVEMRARFASELSGLPVEDVRMTAELHAYFTEELNKTYLCWYALVDGQVASIAGVVLRRSPGSIKNPSGRWGYIMNVYTLQPYRRMGLSKQVMERLMASARECGTMCFELHATPDGEHVYVNMGFHKHGEPTYRLFAE